MPATDATTHGWLIALGADGIDVAAFPLKGQLYVIGSAEGVNIRIPHKDVQPWHAAVVVDSSRAVHLRNLHAAKSFSVNGNHIPVLTKLNSLDIIQFGKYSFRFEGPEATPQIATKSLQGATSGRKAVTVRKGTSAKSKTETPKKSSPKSQSPCVEQITEGNNTTSDVPSEGQIENVTTSNAMLESALENNGHILPLPETDAPSMPVVESESPSLETETPANTSAADIEVVHCGNGEDSDDGEIFLSQQPVQTPKSMLSPKKSPSKKSPSPTKRMSPSKEMTFTPDSASAHSPSASNNSDGSLNGDCQQTVPKPLTAAPKIADPVLSKARRTTSKLRHSHKKTTSVVEVEPKQRRIPRATISRQSTSHTTSSFSELPFVDDMNRSVTVDDEGSQPLQASTTAKKSTAPSGPKLNRKTRQRSKVTRNERPSDSSDIELDPPVPKKQKVSERDSKPTAATYLGVAPPKSIIPASVHFSPPLEGAGYHEQQKHIIRSILKAEQGPLTHRQIMQVARSHEPYAEALKKGSKGNWKVELEAAAGNLNFMPELIRHRDSVNLPL